MSIEEFSKSEDLWQGWQMFIHCISTQQSKKKTNHKEQFKDIPRRTGIGTLMVCSCLCFIFKDELQRSPEKFHGLGQQHSQWHRTMSWNPSPLFIQLMRIVIPKLEPVVKNFTKYMNSCCNSFVYFPFLFKLPALLALGLQYLLWAL